MTRALTSVWPGTVLARRPQRSSWKFLVNICTSVLLNFVSQTLQYIEFIVNHALIVKIFSQASVRHSPP